MNFELSDTQQQLADSLRKFLAGQYGFEQRKAILHSEAGTSAAAWAAFAEMGLTAIALPEADGGFGGGAIDLMPVMEAFGDALVLEPMLDHLLAARLLATAGSDSQRAAWLPGTVDGSVRLAAALLEPGRRYALQPAVTSATPTADGWRLDGRKSVVVGAPGATRLVVSATTSAGAALFLVDPTAPGVVLNASRGVDGLRLADVQFSGVQLAREAQLGEAGAPAQAVLDAAVDFATALQCADALGAMDSANAATLEYIKTRKQFGVAIGSFQVLQHRMVEMTISTEQARSLVIKACSAVDHADSAAERAKVVSAAKIKVADAARQVSQEAVQLHGGMGMTEELKVSHTFRRLTMAAQRFGDADHHLARYARLD